MQLIYQTIQALAFDSVAATPERLADETGLELSEVRVHLTTLLNSAKVSRRVYGQRIVYFVR